ncbi:MAG TPA: hypothetical protein VMW62_09615 [Chloroflexota bacterium]|nr:hypothetical protein [Chloroflexota bacterium]
MAEKEEQVQKKRAVATRGVLEQNRDFFDQFFTRVVKTRFKVASDESAVRHMNIIVGSCTAARCQLTANGHALVLMASQMASTAPEIQISYAAPDGSPRPPVQRSLRYQPPSGWVDPESSHAAGDLTTWLDLTIASFLEWTAATVS